MTKSVVFIGPMGAGKTSIGRRVAKQIGASFVDTDKLIVADHGPISDLFAQRGEAEFRRIERDVVAQALQRGGVVALGGGAVLDSDTQVALRNHLVVLLTISDSAVAQRIQGDKRPLLKHADPVAEWKRIAAERNPIYTSLADVTYDTSKGRIRDVVESAARWAEQHLKESDDD